MTPSDKIDQMILQAPEWQSIVLQKFRALANDPQLNVQEEWKWGTGMWSKQGRLVFAFASFKNHVKFNFMDGAHLPDPEHVFNAGLGAKTSRSIDTNEHESINENALKQMMFAAVKDS